MIRKDEIHNLGNGPFTVSPRSPHGCSLGGVSLHNCQGAIHLESGPCRVSIRAILDALDAGSRPFDPAL